MVYELPLCFHRTWHYKLLLGEKGRCVHPVVSSSPAHSACSWSTCPVLFFAFSFFVYWGYYLHTLKFTKFKCTVWLILVIVHKVLTTSTIKIQNVSSWSRHCTFKFSIHLCQSLVVTHGVEFYCFFQHLAFWVILGKSLYLSVCFCSCNMKNVSSCSNPFRKWGEGWERRSQSCVWDSWYSTRMWQTLVGNSPWSPQTDFGFHLLSC